MQILVWKNKYGDSYYEATTAEQIELAACEILKTLVKDRWIGEPDPVDFTEDEAEILAMTQEQVDALPNVARETINKERKYLKEKLEYFTSEFEEWTNIQGAISGNYQLSVWREPAGYNETEWAEVLEFATTNWPDAVIKNNKVCRPVTAWNVLCNRDGHEYENYDLVKVTSLPA